MLACRVTKGCHYLLTLVTNTIKNYTRGISPFLPPNSLNSSSSFFALSVQIMLVLLQAAELSIRFLLGKNQLCWTSTKDLINDTPPKDRKRRNKPSTQQESNPRPQKFCSAGVCSTAVLKLLPRAL